MKDYIVDLTDGTRLSVNVNFGTLYYLQKMPKFYKLAKKKKENLTNVEKMDLAAASVYAILRSNGKTVTFDEALQLVPMDDEQIRVLIDRIISPLGRRIDIDWAEYRICAAEMGMSEEEFFNCDPIFFNEMYEKFWERKKVGELYGR